MKNGSPDVCARSIRRVGRSFAASFFHDGKYFSTGSSSMSLPSPTTARAVAAATPFVLDAIQKTVSGVILRFAARSA